MRVVGDRVIIGAGTCRGKVETSLRRACHDGPPSGPPSKPRGHVRGDSRCEIRPPVATVPRRARSGPVPPSRTGRGWWRLCFRDACLSAKGVNLAMGGTGSDQPFLTVAQSWRGPFARVRIQTQDNAQPCRAAHVHPDFPARLPAVALATALARLWLWLVTVSPFPWWLPLSVASLLPWQWRWFWVCSSLRLRLLLEWR